MTDDLPLPTEPEIEALETKAKAATPGPWQASCPGGVNWRVRRHDGVFILEQRKNCAPVRLERDAEYIAGASPDVLLRLIAAYRALREERDALKQAAQRLVTALEHEQWDGMGTGSEVDTSRNTLKALLKALPPTTEQP